MLEPFESFEGQDFLDPPQAIAEIQESGRWMQTKDISR